MRVDFYLVEQGGPEGALAPLAAKVLGAGGRLLVVADEVEERRRLSEALWSWRADSFLANGVAGGAHDAAQPILISDRIAPDNGATYLALADGVWREGGEEGFERVLLVFGNQTREAARDIWRMAKGREGWECQFFKQDAGRWTKAG